MTQSTFRKSDVANYLKNQGHDTLSNAFNDSFLFQNVLSTSVHKFFMTNFPSSVASPLFRDMECNVCQMMYTSNINVFLRELMLDLEDVGEEMSPFSYARKMMIALKEDLITDRQYEQLSGDLQLHCQREKIPTENEICSLY